MDDFSENRKSEEQSAEESTIFSAPVEHKYEKLKSSKKRKTATIVMSIVTVLALVFGTLAVIKLIPEKESDSQENSNETVDRQLISVFDFDKSTFDTVTVKNKNGGFVLLSDTEQITDESGTYSQKIWYLKGIDRNKISTGKTEEVVISAAKVTALLEVEKTDFEAAVTVDITSAETGDFSFCYSDILPDNSGMYFRSTLEDKTYIVPTDAAEYFMLDVLEFADISAIAPVRVSTNNSAYVNETGDLLSFDRLEVSGSLYMRPVVITTVPEDEAKTVAFVYKTLSPIVRYAESNSVAKLFGVFSSGIDVTGVCSYDTTAASQNRFGLNNPDLVLKLTVLGQTFSYKFAILDNDNCAVFGTGMNTIKTVSASSEFFGIGETDIYNATVFIHDLDDVKNITFKLGDNAYRFDITKNPDNAEEMFTVLCGGKQIKSEYFQNFYASFINAKLFEYSVSDKQGYASMEINLTYTNGASQTIRYVKASANSYNCYVDGKGTGKITAAVYNKLVSDIKTVSENKNTDF